MPDDAPVVTRGHWVVEAEVIRADGTREGTRVIGTIKPALSTPPAPVPPST